MIWIYLLIVHWCLKNIFSKTIIVYIKIKLFLASDSEKLVKISRNKYSNKIIVSEGLIAHVIKKKTAIWEPFKTTSWLTTCESTFWLDHHINGHHNMKKCEKITLMCAGERITKVLGKIVRYSVFQINKIIDFHNYYLYLLLLEWSLKIMS